MPYSREQLALFGIALAIKRGESPKGYSPQAARIARRTSESELKRMIKEGEKKD